MDPYLSLRGGKRRSIKNMTSVFCCNLSLKKRTQITITTLGSKTVYYSDYQ